MNLLNPFVKGNGVRRYLSFSASQLSKNKPLSLTLALLMLSTLGIALTSDAWRNKSDEAIFHVDVFESNIVAPNGATIGGTVFNDPDVNGEDDGDGGFEGVKIQLFTCDTDGTNELIQTTFTSSDGSYAFNAMGLDPMAAYRVEFSNIPEGYTSSVSGSDNGTETQIVTGFSCDVDYGIFNPSNFCGDDPLVAVVCFSRNNDPNTEPTIVFVKTSDARDWPGAQNANDINGLWGIPTGATAGNYPLTFVEAANVGEISTTFGMDFDIPNSRIYTGSYMRAYAKMGSNSSANGYAEGRIYQIPMNLNNATAGNPSVWLDLEDLYGDGFAGAYLPDNPFPGPQVYGRTGSNPNLIGYTGLGSIKVATDGSEMYVVNLDKREILVIPIGNNGSAPTNASEIKRFPLPTTDCSGSWPDGRDLRAILGLGIHPESGRVYATMTCTGPTYQDMTGYVYSFDPSDSSPSSGDFTLELSIDLDIPRPATSPNTLEFWGQIGHAWNSVTANSVFYLNDPRVGLGIFPARERITQHIQPLLGEVEFGLGDDGSYSMIIGERNRYHDLISSSFYVAGGVLYKACGTEGNWTLSNNTTCGSSNSSVNFTNSGTRAGAFTSAYSRYMMYVGREGSMGSGMLTLGGDGKSVISPVMDNLFNSSTSGLTWLDHSNGERVADVRILGDFTVPGFDQTNFTKANNWGAITTMCEETPLQIGNYAWIDANRDGIQDPCEVPIANVKVKLYTKPSDGGNAILLDSTLTSIDGEYEFSDKLQRGSSYYLVFCGDSYNDEFNFVSVMGTDYVFSTPDIGSGENSDFNDSDVAEINIPGVGSLPAICVTVEGIDHTLDVGLIPKPEIEIIDADIACGPVSAGGTITVKITGGTAPFIYDWNVDVYDGENTLFGVPVGFYSITVTDGDGCMIMDTVSITQEPCDPTPCTGNDMIGGVVFDDPNMDGIDDGDGGFPEIQVDIFECDANGASRLVNTTYTDSMGQYFFQSPVIDDTTKYRIEFSGIPDDYTSSIEGTDNGTETQFVSGYSCDVNFGIVDPLSEPVQLGNYVWIDANGDGVQDPCEEAVSGLTVKLYTKPSNDESARLAATTMTDADGQYYFTDSLTAGETWEAGFERIRKDSSYFIVFCGDGYNDETNVITQGSSQFVLTFSDASMGINADLNDSDASEIDIPDVGMFPAICVTADSINHTLDVGLLPKPDVAIIQVLDPDYDLTGLSIGDSVKFKITVFNQGEGKMDSIEVIDYVPDGFTFDPMIAGNNEWSVNMTGDPITVIADQLLGGEKDSLCIYLTLGNYEDLSDLVNVVEISHAYIGGNAIEDCDSPLNQDPNDNVGSQIDTPADDYILGDGTATGPDGNAGTDQDNVDPATIPICDLALINIIDSIPDNLVVGDTIKFAIILENQGNVPGTNIGVAYTIPDGLLYLPFNDIIDDMWTSTADGAMTTYKDTLNAGEKDTVCIYLELKNLSVDMVTDSSWTTIAEISKFEDPLEPGVSKPDVDSTPDDDPTNDSGGNPDDNTDDITDGDGSGDPHDPTEDMDPDKDEDDHDPAKVYVCDEAVVINTEDDGPYTYGDTVKYTVTIYNQGNGPTSKTALLNTVGDGLNFIETTGNEDAGWTENAGGDLVIMVMDTLMPGDSINICLEMEVEMDEMPDETSWTQIVEITQFEDPEDPGVPKQDIDSTPDSDPTNDPGGNPDDGTDDVIDGDGTGDPMDPIEDTDPTKDEDDHDPVQIEICDLALTNELAEIIEFPKLGDTIKYNVTIYNQGNQGATNIDLGYDIPPGLSYIPLNDGLSPSWTSSTDDLATTTLAVTDTLEPGDKTTVCIYLTVTDVSVDVADVDIWTTLAEIQAFAGEDGGADKQDIDSTPDDDFSNDPGGNPDDNTDNVIGGDGTGDPTDPAEDMDPSKDEDDHDPADIFVCDAALSISTDDDGPHFYGDTVKYEVTIYNQGNGDITNIAFQDIVSSGQQYIATTGNDTSGWIQADDGLLTNIYEDIIGPGDSATICLELLVEATETPSEDNYTQLVEITSFEDPENPGINKGDVDSTPDSDPDNDSGGNLEDDTDDEVNGMGTGDPDNPMEDMDPLMDEDDHDPVSIKVYDVAVIHQKTYPDSAYNIGDIVELDVIICNQSNDDVTDVKIVNYVPLALDANINQNAIWDLANLPMASYVHTSTMQSGDSDTIKVFGVFQIDGTSDIEDFVSRIEVCRFEDELGNGTDATGPDGGIQDADSTPDTIETNDAGGAPITDSDDVKDGDGLNGGGVFLDEDPLADEDDHDPALIGAVDIAITISPVDTVTPTMVGDTVVFEIDVCNQGSFDLQNIVLVCYVPTGFEMMDPNWTQTSVDSIYELTISDVIPLMETDSVHVMVMVDSAATVNNMKIGAEVASFTDDRGVDFTMFDIDSEADRNPVNDPGGIVYSLSDDAKDGDGSGMPGDDDPRTDEDDHDCAIPPVLDLALIKEVIDPKPAVPGDSITYLLTVMNQGNIAAKDIKIIDLIPSGLSLADDDWILLDANNASYDISEIIERDSTVEVEITFTINPGATVDDMLNVAEIETVFNVAGLNIDGFDIDSAPADDNGADAAAVFTSEDDNPGTNGFLGESPDDSDPAESPVFDLALRKVLTNGPVATVGTLLDFDITIFNQGNMDAVGISIVDYIPEGMEFEASSIGLGWSTSGANAVITIADTLKAGADTTISITLNVTDQSDPFKLVNVAEIFEVGIGVDQEGNEYTNPADIDSEADMINQDLGGEPYSELDDIISQNGRTGEDEDDNDQAYPILCQSMACTGRVNLILNEDCSTIIEPSTFLRGNPFPARFYDITILDASGKEHANAFDKTDDGQEFSVSIINNFCDNQCWGIVKIENKNVPIIQGSTTTSMCGAPQEQFTNLADVAIEINNGCNLPVTDLTEEFIETGDKCQDQVRIRVVRGTVEVDGKLSKIILRRDTIVMTPLDTSMVTCPGSMDLLDVKVLSCDDLEGSYPTPAVVAKLMGSRMAYPYVDKGLSVDSTLVTVKVDRDSTTKEKVELADGTWALFDVVTKYQVDSSYYAYDTSFSEILLKDGEQTCNLAVKYEDEVYESCVGEIGKLRRKWTVLDWCGGGEKVCYQWIIVTDDTAPVLELTQSEVLADVSPWICSAEVELSDYIKKAESCTDVTVSYTADAGVLSGSKLSNLWLAESPVTVTVTAANACGETTDRQLTVKVHDMTAPVAIALDQINVSLTGDTAGDGGVAKVEAGSIDAGSHDSGCGDVNTCLLRDDELQDPLTYEGYWSTTPGLTSATGLYESGFGTHLQIDGAYLYNQHGCTPDGYIYTYELLKGQATQTGSIPYVICKDYVKFCCGDLGDHKVALVVNDNSAYSAAGVSWTTVTVEDKSVGRWSCIEEVVPCAYVEGFVPKATPRYGSDLCDQYEIREISREDNASTCGEGSLRITWGAYDEEGVEVSTNVCVYALSGRKDFNPYEIKWPKHYTDESYEGVSRECEIINDEDKTMIVEYLQTSIDMGGSFECSVMSSTGAPSWCTEACGLIASSYEDEEIEAGDACKKIVRRWTVIDWCTWEANGSQVDDENDSLDEFEAVDDTWLRVNEGIEDALTDSRAVSTGYVNGSRVTDLECEECEKPSGASDDIYFRYRAVDEDGYYTYDQVIKIIDETAPVVDAADYTVSITEGASVKGDNYEGCVGEGTVTATATDICGVDTEVEAETLTWSITTRDEDGNIVAGPKQVIGATADMTTGLGTAGAVHEIIWVVTDGCGNSVSEVTEVTFADEKNPTPVCIQDISTATMSTDGTVEIWASDYDLGSFDNCSDVTVGFLVDENGDLTEDVDLGDFVPSVTFDCEDLTAGQSGTQNIRMYVIDALGNYDFCNVRLRIDDNSDACPDGDVEAALIAGELRTESGDMIESVDVSLTGGESKNMITPVDGNYAFANNQLGIDYQVVPQKDGDYLNGVSTLDLVKIQRHILGIEDLDSPYKLIAGDVNSDERISAIDLIHLRKLLLGVDVEFSNNTSWRFVEASQKFDSPLSPWPFMEVVGINNLTTNQRGHDFIGVKIGDVSGNAVANSAIAAEGRTASIIELNAIDQVVTKGDMVELSISSDNFENIVGLQYTMEVEGLKYVGIESGAIEIKADQVAQLDANTITTAWHQGETSEISSTTLFTMVFEATSDIVLSESVHLSSRVTEQGAYEATSTQASDVTLTWDDELNAIGEMQLMQNQPNPFRKATDISFVLPQGGVSTLTIFDVAGKVVFERIGDYSAGVHEIRISKEDLGIKSGVLYYQLESNDQVATMKMILVQ